MSVPSSARVFFTFKFNPGVIRFIMSSKLSRSIVVNSRWLIGLSGVVGFPEKSPITPTTNGSSRTSIPPSGLKTSYVRWTCGLRTRSSFM